MKTVKSLVEAQEAFKTTSEVKCACKNAKKLCKSLIEAAAFYKMMEEGPSSDKQIVLYFQCALCLAELPKGVSPQEYGLQEVGWTPLGLQVWCKRHQCNICNIDFQGHRHPANTGRKPREGEEQEALSA